MKEKILILREKGWSYRRIQEELGCSKGTISYHCGKGVKTKTKIRRKKISETLKYKIYRKIDGFKMRNDDHIYKYVKRNNVEDKLFYDKIINNPYCYLTGSKIDLNDNTSYNLDHIVPFVISKDNSVENMGLARKDVNHSKSYLTVSEYLNLCEEVLINNGYEINKIGM